MSNEDWSNRFDQLFDLYLIDVGDNFYSEALPFDNPEELQYRFKTLET
jgi:hypothetical protein